MSSNNHHVGDISNNVLRRLCYKSGIKLMSSLVFWEIRGSMVSYLEDVISKVVVYLNYSRRKTVNESMVSAALADMGGPTGWLDQDHKYANCKLKTPKSGKRRSRPGRAAPCSLPAGRRRGSRRARSIRASPSRSRRTARARRAPC